MRLPAQDGQSLTLHEKGTTRGPRHDVHSSRTKPWPRSPQGRNGAELAFDEARQRAVVVIAAGDEVIEVVSQEAGERAGFRVPRSAGPRSTRVRGAVVVEVGRLRVAHAPLLITRRSTAMHGSVGRS